MDCYKININKQSFTKEDAVHYEYFLDILIDLILKYNKYVEEEHENELIDKQFK
jgi:hypothetical protein